MEFIKKYNPDRSSEWNYGGAKWRLSRSKIDLFIECPRCFYLDNKLGTKRPSMPSFNLNIAVDELFKKEFDTHRVAGTPHPIMLKYGVEAVPFQHEKMDEWRDPFVGVAHKHQPTGLVVSGGVDDLWVNKEGKLIIVDYKATSKVGKIEKLGDSPWEKQYQRQLGVYRWLLEQNDFEVEEMGYLVYANASKDESAFDDKLTFETTLVECPTKVDWIETTLQKIKAVLDSDEIPPSGEGCEYCPYREASGKKLLSLHMAAKKVKLTNN
ncbi:MAG: PD-(D/E)XK nuclease family protein [Candidatus Paceibacterota bacterium]